MSPTGPASGRGCVMPSDSCSKGWQHKAVPWTLTSRRSARTHGPCGSERTWTTELLKEPTLNAEPAVQRRLLDLQDLDLQLDQVAHKRTSLPEHQALKELAAEKAVVDR